MIALASAGIARKRARQVARAFPALARDLGADYQETLAAFARATPPGDGGAIADGLALGTVVARKRRLSDDAKVEQMVAAVTSCRGVPRRVPHLAATLTRHPRGIVMVTHLPVLGTRVLSLRAPQHGTTARSEVPGRVRR
jgi:hypothetical protein